MPVGEERIELYGSDPQPPLPPRTLLDEKIRGVAPVDLASFVDWALFLCSQMESL
jgi:hypothetical protein